MTGPVEQDDAKRTFTIEQLAALVPPSRRPDSQAAVGKVTPEQVEAALFPKEDSMKRVRIICTNCQEDRLLSVEESDVFVFCVKCGTRILKKVVHVEEDARAQTRELFPGAFSRLFEVNDDDDGLEEFTTLVDRKEEDDTGEEPIAEVTMRIPAMQLDEAEEVPEASVVEPIETRKELPAIIHESFVDGGDPLPLKDVSILRAKTQEIRPVGIPIQEELFNSDWFAYPEPSGYLVRESLPDLYLNLAEHSVQETSAGEESDKEEDVPLLVSDKESIALFQAQLLALLVADDAAALRRASEVAVAERGLEPEQKVTPEPEDDPELPAEAIMEGEAPKSQGYPLVPYLAVVIGSSLVLGSLTYYLAKYFAG
jgi:hypothetical protein